MHICHLQIQLVLFSEVNLISSSSVDSVPLTSWYHPHMWNPKFLELPQTLPLCNLLSNSFSHNCSNPRADVIQVKLCTFQWSYWTGSNWGEFLAWGSGMESQIIWLVIFFLQKKVLKSSLVSSMIFCWMLGISRKEQFLSSLWLVILRCKCPFKRPRFNF